MFWSYRDFSSKSKYILIGLEDTNTAVYTCSLEPNRTFGNLILGLDGTVRLREIGKSE
jgi:hypothetical protein